ncbi:maltose ABC transporter permease [Paenibacillus baekrokdamisoli]|uniref:Maltose ABC transporter permease n=1 Tax=Paenibacillus baekrokdamisoli TaxID=1712516 RepID=A0A3G9JFA3_9BACL|nr:carbohydrate ABC transporter permease [Paenibacillus baekrokdamisoli]MBB3068827.1 putative aldouronate transport system permease protein [Paenibacillus baekrokdamisoli]BBH23653.1 maltose ABC transporter permease [Paenibacillus baekrokdamisoli]
MKLSHGERLSSIMIYFLLTLLMFITFYPFWNSGVISFNTGADTSLGGVTFWPRHFTLENYDVVFQDKRLVHAFLISILRTVIGTLLSITLTAIFSYGMSKKELVGRKYYMIMCIIPLYFSGGLIPSYMLISSLGLMNSFWVLIIPGLISIWNMIVFRTFFLQLPGSIEESAKMDGCSYWGTLFRIVLPISGPVVATLSLFTAVEHWNDWFTATLYISDTNLLPIQTLLQQILSSNIMSEQMMQTSAAAQSHMAAARTITSKSLSMATMMVATIPIILVYPFVQKYFVKGVMVGSLKE